MPALPQLMVAPNGATRTKSDHPNLPITLEEMIQTAKECQAAGADGLHLHLRDETGAHLLDGPTYQAWLAALRAEVPELKYQTTTEAAGVYGGAFQRALAPETGCDRISAAVRELNRDIAPEDLRAFYRNLADQGVSVQHILYAPEDFALLRAALDDALWDAPDLQLLFVAGRYAVGQNSAPSDLVPFLAEMHARDLAPDWGVCAFGAGETECLLWAHDNGGKMRIGFENSFFHQDGTKAKSNAERVAALRKFLT